MIYSKNANFPYPIFYNESNDYNDARFEVDVDLTEKEEAYDLEINTYINSDFILDLLSYKKAELLLVIQSKDNQFHKLQNVEKNGIEIKKKDLSLYRNKTTMQVMIRTLSNISFSKNDDLNEFYEPYRNEISLKKGMALGFSNLVIFDGRQEKPFDLFKKTKDQSIISDVEIELANEVIVIKYKEDSTLFYNSPQYRDFINPYIYTGLDRALSNFIKNSLALKDTSDLLDETVYLDQINKSDLKSPLDEKLYDLLINKNIHELNLESLDETIHLIADNIIKKYVNKVRSYIDEN